MKKKLLPLFIFFSLCIHAGAQKWVEMMNDPRVNFYEVQKEFKEYYKKKNIDGTEPRKDGPYNRFKRWEAYMEPRVYPTGIRPNVTHVKNEWLKQKSRTQKNSNNSNWTFMGPSVIPSNGGGAGKANSVAIDPSNPQKIYLGTSGGGVWISEDGGNTWSCNTDYQLPSLVIIDININPINTNILYICLKEGVYKSIDAGLTWQSTSLEKTSYRIQIDPINPSTLLSACSDGIYRSTDAGTSWTQVVEITSSSELIKDIEFNPGNSNIVYCSGFYKIFRSVDNGITWAETSMGIPSNAFGIKLAVTPANPNLVYAIMTSYMPPTNGGFNALCRSTDAGLTWTVRSSSPNILGYDPTGAASGGQGAYCLTLAVSPINENVLYAGGINIWKSSNGGVNWTIKSDWLGTNHPYVHADQQDLKFAPGSGSTIYSCNDGGINVSTNSGTSWADLSNGLKIMELYKLSSSATNPNLVVAGAQDNGTNKNSSNSAARINGGDGLQCIVDYLDSNVIYSSYQYGAMYRSTDGGLTGSYISPTTSQNNFFTNFEINPINRKTLYAAADGIFKTVNSGTSWFPIATNLFQDNGGSVNIPIVAAPSDTNTIYVGRLTEIYKTTNGGNSWTTITPPVSQALFISGIAIDPTDKNKIFVSFSGYAAYTPLGIDKVYKTLDGGATWINITQTGLPSIPVNCIVYQNGSPDGLYVGTDLGVYYTDNTMNHWLPFLNGLPNVRVNDLDIQYSAGKLRAATYGRGIWESNLNIATINTNDAGIINIISPNGTICSNTISPTVEIKNFGSGILNSAQIKYQIDSEPVNTYLWSGNLSSFGSTNISLPALTVNSGLHTLKVYTIQANNQIDVNTANDTAFSTFEFPQGLTLPYNQGFEDSVFPPNGIKIKNYDYYITWQRKNDVSFSGNACAFMDNFNYYNDGMIDELVLPMFNFSSSIPQLSFEYSYQLRYDTAWYNYTDTLAVEVSTDCGNTWNIVYKKYDIDLVTTTPVFNMDISYLPSSNNDWMLETIDLSAFGNLDKVLIKFKNINGRGNQLYLDDINIISQPVGTKSIQKPKISIFPNPNEGAFTLLVQNTNLEGEVIITSVLGKTIYSGSISSGFNTMDISKYSSGLYFYKVVCKGKEIANGKFVKK